MKAWLSGRREARKRGWMSKARVRRYDDAGVHPEFAAHICRVGQQFSARHAVTEPLSESFSVARAVFLNLLQRG